MLKHCTGCRHRCELPKLMRDFKVGVEVGVRHGSYAEVLLRTWPGFLHLIDPWEDYAEYVDAPQDHDYNFQLTKDKLAPHEGRFKMWREKDSHELADKIGQVDFAYIDGNHEWRYVDEDIHIWWEHLSPGGILAGHDMFYMDWPRVTEAVIMFAAKVNRDVHLVPGKIDCLCGEGGSPSWYMRKG